MDEISEAERAVLSVGEGQSNELPHALVAAWMRSPSLEVQGIAFAVLASPHLLVRVTQGISHDAWFEFSVGFLRRCLFEDSGGEWALSGYEAAHDLANAYVSNPGPGNAYRRDALRRIMEDAVLLGDEALTKRVCHGALEHMLDTFWVREEFSIWLDDPALKSVYAEAVSYSV
jgi:hypothetical protein